MIEYEVVGTPRKRVTIVPEFVESLSEQGSEGKQTVISMASGQQHIIEAPYEQVRIQIGQLLGSELGDEEFEDEQFLDGSGEIN